MNHTCLCSAVQTVARNHECERDENLLTYDIEEHDKQTWIQDLLIQDQDQDQDFDVQDQDRDSRLTRLILEVRDWDGL